MKQHDEIQPFVDYKMTVEDNIDRLLDIKIIASRAEVSADDIECMIQANRDAAWEDQEYDVYEHGTRGLGVSGY